MPRLTRWFIRTGILYLGAALLLGLATAAGRPYLPPALLAVLAGPLFIHLLTVGWLTNLIFGVAHWMFPIASRERPRGRERLAWVAYALLNGGLLLRIVTEPTLSLDRAAVAAYALTLSALLQAAGGLAFAFHIWPRVRGR